MRGIRKAVRELFRFCHHVNCERSPRLCPVECGCGRRLNVTTAIVWEIALFANGVMSWSWSSDAVESKQLSFLLDKIELLKRPLLYHKSVVENHKAVRLIVELEHRIHKYKSKIDWR